MQTSTSDSSSSKTMAAQSDINEVTLRLLSQELGTEWESLATFLNISADTISLIKQDYRFDGTEEQIFQMLSRWKNDFDPEVNEDGMEVELMKALKHRGRRDLAYKVRQGTLRPQEKPACARRESVDCLTDAVLRKLSDGLGNGWEQLATYLGMPSAQVGRIKRDHHGAAEQVFQMLIKWRNDNNNDIPVEVLKAKLKTIGRNDLAVKLMDMIEGQTPQ